MDCLLFCSDGLRRSSRRVDPAVLWLYVTLRFVLNIKRRLLIEAQVVVLFVCVGSDFLWDPASNVVGIA